MAILNYTTTVDADKSILEIEKILINHGALNISKDFEQKLPIALNFVIQRNNIYFPVRLPANPEAVLNVMRRGKVRPGLVNREQAYRVAWRIIKDWIEAQMAILETEQVVFEQIFLPYIQNDKGKTIYQIFTENGQKFLIAGQVDNRELEE
jgi:hypothetical protein